MRTRASFIALGLALMAMSAAAQTTVTSSGTAATTGNVPYVSASTSTSTTVSPSPISVSGSNVGIGVTNPGTALQVTSGNASVQMPGGDPSFVLYKGDGQVTSLYFGVALTGQTLSGNTANRMSFYTNTSPGWAGGSEKMVIQNAGNVGIGTTNPGAKLEVSGSVKLTAGSGASITFQDGSVQTVAYTGLLPGGDYADSVDVTGDRAKYDAGDLLVIDPDHPGKFLKSAAPYSTSVAGIFSTKPGTVGRRQTGPKSPDEVPMAMIGLVPPKVTAENGPIRPGDLLVTASMTGYAMKGTDRGRMLGAVVGKALGSLDSGTGVIEVVVTLQ